MKKPTAKKNKIVVQKLEGETLVYDLKENKAFCLNETSALVWELCDGSRTPSEMREMVSKKLRTPISEEFVNLALDQLCNDGLLKDSAPNYLGGVSRREAIRNIGFASVVVLPVVSSLVAPNAAMSQSLVENGGACPGGGSDCVSGNCIFSQCCAAGSIARNPPGFGLCTTQSQPQFDVNCCSGSSSSGMFVCPPGENSWVCDPY